MSPDLNAWSGDAWSNRVTSLNGRIEEGVLPNLLQYLSLSQASGCLLLRHPKRLHANVYVDEGRVVFVDAKPLYDLAALAALLRWTEGRFAFRPGVRAPRNTLTSSTETLLLQATQKADEIAGRGANEIDADTVLVAVTQSDRPTGQGLSQNSDDSGPSYEFGPVSLLGDPARGSRPRVAEPVADTVSLSLSALELWRRLDGVSSLRQLAASSGRRVPDVVSAALELFDNALVDYVSLVVADPRFAQELAREAVDLLGPVGEIVVEDALYELGLSVDAIPIGEVDALIGMLEDSFDNPFSRAEFLRRVTELRRLFALESPEVGGR